MPTNNELYTEAVAAATRLFSDTSVSKGTAKRNLDALIGEIEIMLDTIEEDDDPMDDEDEEDDEEDE